jgi:formiminotetrahydrofolate cyclodeaminase
VAGATLDELLDGLAAAAPSAAGGTAAAVTAAMAASLVAMVGRASQAWTEGADVAERAGTLRGRLLTLGEDDVEAFAAVLRAYRSTGEARAAELTAALIRASEVPLEIAERAAEVAELAAGAARDGRGPMRLDAEAAAVLAEAATRAASLLVSANLLAIPDGRESEQVSRLLEAAQRARERAAAVVDHTS